MMEKFFLEEQNFARYAQDVIEHLASWEQTFYVIRTTRSVKIRYIDTDYYYVENKLSKGSLTLINRLRKEVKERMNDVELKSRSDVKYYEMKKVREGEKLYEYDLTAAYVHALAELGLCSDATYLKLLDLEKKERLAVVGSLATKKFIEHHVSGRLAETSLHAEETEPAWWTICYHVDQIMLEYMCQHSESTVGYWVDALFSRRPLQFSRPHKQRIVTITELRGSQFVLDDARIFPM